MSLPISLPLCAADFTPTAMLGPVPPLGWVFTVHKKPTSGECGRKLEPPKAAINTLMTGAKDKATGRFNLK